MIHFDGRLSGKIVFAGPHKSGKSATLAWIVAHGGLSVAGALLRMHVCERMVDVEGDEIVVAETLPRIDVHDDVYGYDFIPLSLGKLGDEDLAVTAYALPGHPDAHEAIGRMWRGIDLLVFVADGRRGAMEANVGSWSRVRTNPWFDPETACVLQINRRDAVDAASASEIAAALGWQAGPVVETISSEGVGLSELTAAIVHEVKRRATAFLAAEAG